MGRFLRVQMPGEQAPKRLCSGSPNAHAGSLLRNIARPTGRATSTVSRLLKMSLNEVNQEQPAEARKNLTTKRTKWRAGGVNSLFDQTGGLHPPLAILDRP